MRVRQVLTVLEQGKERPFPMLLLPSLNVSVIMIKKCVQAFF